jgi:hypothetical protein
MIKTSTILLAIGLALASACKKEDKPGDPGGKAGTGDKAGDPGDKAGDPGDKAGGTGGEAGGTGDPGDKVGTGPAADPAPAGDEVKITPLPHEVGTIETQVETSTQRMAITAQPGQVVDLTIVGESRKSIEILEVAGGVQTKVKATYDVEKRSQTMMGKTEDQPSPLHGKSYIVWADGGAIKATTADGQDVSAAELEELDDDFADEVGRVEGIVQVFANHTYAKGAKVDLTPEDLKLMAEDMGKKGGVPQSGTITLVDTDGKLGTFEVRLLAKLTEDGSDAELDMTITLVLDLAKVRPNEMKMTGTIKGTVKGMPVDGTMEGAETKTYNK